jgi:hypothetical protein
LRKGDLIKLKPVLLSTSHYLYELISNDGYAVFFYTEDPYFRGYFDILSPNFKQDYDFYTDIFRERKLTEDFYIKQTK